jgi:chromatin segregation and condensation protein Rec8/ScpA/Scc1 (kleisin family)
VAFLAMLELVKQGAVRVNQEKDFEDIEIESENINTPTYG